MLGQRQPRLDAGGGGAHNERMLLVGDNEVADASGLRADDKRSDSKDDR